MGTARGKNTIGGFFQHADSATSNPCALGDWPKKKETKLNVLFLLQSRPRGTVRGALEGGLGPFLQEKVGKAKAGPAAALVEKKEPIQHQVGGGEVLHQGTICEIGGRLEITK